jgi:hypothetical protein
MLKTTAFAIVGISGLIALTPIPSKASPTNGGLTPAGTHALLVQYSIYDRCTCVRKSSGRLVCGIYDRYGGFHESEVCYRYRPNW